MQPVVVHFQHLSQFIGIASCIKGQRLSLLAVMQETTIKVGQQTKTDRLALQIDALSVLRYTELHPPPKTNQFISYALHIAQIRNCNIRDNALPFHQQMHHALKIRLTTLSCLLQNGTDRTQTVTGMQITTFSRTKPSLDEFIRIRHRHFPGP